MSNLEDSPYDADIEDEDAAEIAEAHRQLDAESLQHISEHARPRFRRSTAPGSTTAARSRRRPAVHESGHAQRRQRRRRTFNTPPAGSDSFGAPHGFEDAGQWQDAAHAIEMAALQAQIAELEAQLAAERAAQEALAGSESDAEASHWSQRSQRAEASWREQAPELGAAMLHTAAAPDPEQLCSGCNEHQGCTVRYVCRCHSAPVQQPQPTPWLPLVK